MTKICAILPDDKTLQYSLNSKQLSKRDSAHRPPTADEAKQTVYGSTYGSRPDPPTLTSIIWQQYGLWVLNSTNPMGFLVKLLISAYSFRYSDQMGSKPFGH